MAFFKACQDVVKEDVMKTMEDFYKKGFLDEGSNATFISLILKRGAASIMDFRPISLVGSIYKIISKTLTNHMKGVLTTIIAPN